MSNYELWSLIIAIISILIATKSVMISSQANKKSNKLNANYNNLTEKSNLFASGQTELQLSQTIDETKRNVMNIIFKITELPCDAEQQVKDALMALMDSAMESNVNAYESACGLYLDNKIDKERFKKLYHSEVKRVIEDTTHNKFYIPEATSKYQATWKVYKEWNILE